jgi:hypothetical protein
MDQIRMKRAKQLEEGKGGLDLVEEAAHLFRAASPRTLATYYAGTVPFVLAFLYFIVDMSRSPFAEQHAAEASLAVSLLFFWMKLCQASFTARIRAQLALRPMPEWGLRGSLKVLLPQMVIHSTGLFLLPLALVLMLPFAWIYAFYQNTTVLADPESPETGKLAKRAWQQTSLWVFENHTALSIGILFGLFVLLNWTFVAVMIPGLIDMLLGIETPFSRSPTAMVNTTFIGIIFGLTYLCVDPILKTLYVLRCFYGEAIHSGEDLKADLRQFGTAPHRLAGLLVLSIALSFCGSLHAAPTAATRQSPRQPVRSEISQEQLDRQIDQVIRQSKYTWRLPRKPAADSQKGFIARFFDRVVRLLQDGVSAVARAIGRLVRWIFEGRSGLALPGFGWISSSGLLFLLLTVLACVLAILFLRLRKRKAALQPVAAAIAVARIPDLADETIRADQLPEDGWTRLARQLLEEGEYRLAIRAYYLSSLANLAQRNLVAIAVFKSNRDYENELRRRGHAIPLLAPLFGENLMMLERIWYGLHVADRDLVVRFALNVDRIKTAA